MSSSPAATPSILTIEDDLAVALRLADAADAVSLARFDAADLEVSTKADATFVTDADLATERAIRSVLESERPGDGIFGEEFGSSGSTHRQWIIDPIDGTANYLKGVPVWGTLISLAIDGVPVVGVVSMPALGRRWWGSTAHGAFTDTPQGPRRLVVSSVSELDQASVSFQSIEQWDEAGYLPALVALTRRAWRDRAYGDVWSYMLLAEGRLDVVAEFGVKEYDIAAVVPIVREAGGTFTAFDGTDTLSARSAMATNGILHNEVLEFVHAEHSLTDKPEPAE